MVFPVENLKNGKLNAAGVSTFLLPKKILCDILLILGNLPHLI